MSYTSLYGFLLILFYRFDALSIPANNERNPWPRDIENGHKILALAHSGGQFMHMRHAFNRFGHPVCLLFGTAGGRM